MAKRKWTRFLELIRLSSASPIEPPAESRRSALQSRLGPTFPGLKGTGGITKRSQIRAWNELDIQIAQLRHAYSHLAAERVKHQRELADGLIAPTIRFLEGLRNG